MSPAAQTLKTRRLFQIVFKKGKISRGKLLKIWVLADEKASAIPKIGIMVSRKVDLRAVKRNLWKRRIREAFRLMQHEILPGRMILVQAQKQNEIPSFAAIQEELRKLLRESRNLR